MPLVFDRSRSWRPNQDVVVGQEEADAQPRLRTQSNVIVPRQLLQFLQPFSVTIADPMRFRFRVQDKRDRDMVRPAYASPVQSATSLETAGATKTMRRDTAPIRSIKSRSSTAMNVLIEKAPKPRADCASNSLSPLFSISGGPGRIGNNDARSPGHAKP